MSDPHLFFSRAAIEACASDLLERKFPGLNPSRTMPGTSAPHLAWMLEMVVVHAHEWPLDKSGRWLGFVQGVLAMVGELDIEEERNRSRPVYQTAYASDGLKVPETL